MTAEVLKVDVWSIREILYEHRRMMSRMSLAVNPEIFRQYDIRGLTEKDLTPAVARVVAYAFGKKLREAGRAKAVVGRDNRLSSPTLRDAVVGGFSAAGLEVLDLGTVTTPMFYFAREHLGIDGGAMITGSHNPPEFNGLKLAFGPATIYGEEIEDLRRRVEAVLAGGDWRQAPDGNGDALGGGTIRETQVEEAYLDMLAAKIKLGPRRLKVVVDCGNGTAGFFAVPFLTRLGCEVISLYCEPDGHFPHHHPDPVKRENLTDLIAKVKESGADLGVAYDGDADRIGVVDETGEVIWGDRLMILYWREILAKHPGAQAIIEVKCSQALVDEVRRLGGRPLFYKTGHSLIKAKMREIGAPFTGEMSGHMFFADEYYGFDDAFYATGRLLRILSNTDRRLSEFLADVPEYFSTAETRVPCEDRFKFQVVEELTKRFKNEYDVIDVDGARVQFPDGWGLVRASNTQPVIVARCEATSREGLERITAKMKTELLRFKEVGDFDWEM